VIVVEGPDGAGKTTLVKRLLEDIPNLELQPRVVSKGAEAMVDLKQWVVDDLSKGFGPRLYDRHRLISEPIYGPLLRGKMEPGFDQVSWLSQRFRHFASLDPVLIFCLPPDRVVLDNIMRSRDEQPSSMDLGKSLSIYWLYRMEASRWTGSWVYDYTGTRADEGYEVLVRSIQGRLNVHARRSRRSSETH
jgi:hypothetical protein